MSYDVDGSQAALPRPVIVLTGMAAATVTIAGMKLSSGILGPVMLALVMTIAAHPMRGWLTRRHFPGWAASLTMIATVYLVLVVFALAVLASIARFAALLPAYKTQFAEHVDKAISWLTSLGITEDQLRNMAQQLDVNNLAALAGEVLGDVTGLMSLFVFVVSLLLFFAIDAAWFPYRVDATPPSRRGLATAVSTFAAATRSYLLVSTAFGLIVAVLDTGALWLLGIPAPLVWGLLAFMTNYIPNVGFVIGVIPPMILGLLEGGFPLMLAVLAVYTVLNVVIQSIIQPRVVGGAVGLSSSLTFLSLIFWAWVLGALGALLAIPLSLLVKALLVDSDPGARWITPLIDGSAGASADEPALDPAGLEQTYR
jgi:predicted PurR-regulated permease PerM